ncbi:hypothetical protein [Ruminiclostridium cellulolyticum]|uniref:Uncharacterized protein n=1 Tax=Ruminiclostridium cellulolyticum (strain ATCC 35319 / DSM 5812 / JCM 6584 / H10) TaxID=394503 RepID=B8I4M2_RUMCH|nr:hypothetical protein [Ruminiclostridium cellulolyticum]ACL74576.1 hypothetical protein Ccel_0189 [Ruminiclostridium cellulolyticum H10]
MNKKIVVIVTITILIAIAGIKYFKLLDMPVHKNINKEDVLSIESWSDTHGITEIKDPVLFDNIVTWFNNSSDIRENPEFAGTTPAVGINIKLKSGKGISILEGAIDFEVQRNDVRDKNVSYFAKQKDIAKYLDNLFTGVK